MAKILTVSPKSHHPIETLYLDREWGRILPTPTVTFNLLPRVSPLHALGSERGKTLVGAGHVSPKIWEITNKWLEGGAVECQFAHTKCTGDGKTCPSENQLAESRVSCQVVQIPLKRCIKRANLWMWAAVDFVNQMEILETLAKSLQQSRNRLFCSCIATIFAKTFSFLVEWSVKKWPYSHAVYSPFESVLLMCYFLWIIICLLLRSC